MGDEEKTREQLITELGRLRQQVAEMQAARLETDQTAAQRHQNHRAFRSMLDIVPDSLLLIEPDGTVIECNQTLARRVGIERDALIGANSFSLFPADVASFRRTKVRQVVETGQPAHFNDSRFGREMNSIINPVFNDAGEVEALAVFGLDVTEYQQTAAELKDSRARYRSITDGVLDTSAVGIFILDADFKVVWINQAMALYFGLKRSEVIGQDKRQLVQQQIKHISATPQEFTERLLQTYQNNSYVENFECHVLPGEGRDERWLEHWSQPITSGLYAGGRIEHYTDITARKQAESSLIEREQLSSAILNSLSAHVAILDQNGMVTTVNQAWRNFAIENGLSAEAGLGQNYFTICELASGPSSEGALTAEHGILAVLSGELPEFSLEYPCHSPTEKRWFWLHAVPLHNHMAGVVVSHMNITALKQAELKLDNNTRRLALATSSAKMGIWDWDIVANTLTWDALNFELYRVKPEEFTGAFSDWANCLHPDDLPLAREEVRAVLANEKDYHTEFRVVWPDGQIRHFEAHAQLQRAADGSPLRLVGVNWDITERVELAAKHNELQAQFYQIQKMESIGRLAGGIAHDFNNLLVPITGFAEIAMMSVSKDSRIFNQLTQIKQAGERAGELTRQILAFSRQQVLEIKVIDLNLVVDNFEKMIRRLMGENIVVQATLTPQLFPVRADIGQIEQILLNLAVNARDAMANGGTCTLSTENVTLDGETAARYNLPAGHYAALMVSDTGHGIDESIQAHIFEPFFTTKTPGNGTGLGLATVFGIVKQHQGSIFVTSQPGCGSTFTVYLPALDDPIGAFELKETEDLDAARGTETVLVVEDDDDVLNLICYALRSYGYHVLKATDPFQALEIAAVYPAPLHLLIADAILPGLNGLEMYRQMLEAHPDLRVLYISGYAPEVSGLSHLASTQDGNFLEKPFATGQLLQSVRTTLDQKQNPPPVDN